jgi:selenocysteine lyase/cysteine desulfurase
VTAARLGDRSLFPRLEPRAYLNHAGVSPPSEPVRLAAHAAVDDFARRGGAAVGAAVEARRRLRGRVAELLGARPDDVALTSNTTAGIQAVALDFPWRPGDRVVLLDGEFPANVTPWQQAAATFGLEIAWVPVAAFLRSTDEGLACLEAELRRGARLVAVSAVQFRSGLRMPVAAMAARCAAAGAEIFVDAVQAAGCVPIDVRGVDYLAAGAHKWLMGILGAGFLYVRPGRAEALVPRTAGWLSHEDPVRFLVEGPGQVRYDRPIRRRADLVEAGGLPEASLAALLASLEILLGLGVPSIERHVEGYLDALEPGLVARGFRSLRAPQPARRSGILAVEPPPGTSTARISAGLAERGVACATPDGALRFSPHWPNAVEEVPEVLEAVDGALRAARAGGSAG